MAGQIPTLEPSHNGFDSSPLESSSSETLTSWLSNKDVLRGAKFGMPYKQIWESASQSSKHKDPYETLRQVVKQMEEAGAQVFDVNFPSAEEIISSDGWDWSYGNGQSGSKLSEFVVVAREFYRSITEYLSTLENNKKGILSLEDIMAYNIKHNDKEGGLPGTHPAWPTGQDSFEGYIDSKDWDEEVYSKALEYIVRKSREEGIDAALNRGNDVLDGLLVPLQADGGSACSVAAKAGYPMITVPVGVNDDGIPFGVGIIQTAWKDHLLVKYGSAIEDLIKARHKPTFKNFNATNYTYVGGSKE
jgi:amidase